ncbi:sulfotransferase family protein [Thermodesulfatator autotrophicus]|uniref:Sulfotransferase n=1 Tax=Thermodesulfatator autotrophicus TaxID=1795632 RepID=A0A177E5L2_9BACT|nr:sulfotransferase [Thermodesulfatator autotrophicus]OAG27006.1 hypothetical protein TH606_09265 [Thermodesulfatator autotrophicus]
MSNEPIFIVGTPRSGTTLLAAMLSAHSRLDCGPETHFFCHLTRKIEKEISSRNNWPEIAVQYITSLKLTGEYIYKLFDLSRNEIYSFLLDKPPSVNSSLEALTQLHALKLNKHRWVEKTPNHLLFLPKLRKYYPNAFIIRSLRDFRDSALSMSKLPWASKSTIANIFRLNEWYYLSEKYLTVYSNLLVLPYERLIYNPENYLGKVCNFINERFELSMIYNRDEVRHLYSKKEWWKTKVTAPLDKSRCYVWKREMDKDIQLATTYIAMNMLKKYNYEIDVPPPKETIFLFPLTRDFVERNESLFLRLAKERIRLVGCSNIDLLIDAIQYENPSKIVFLYPMNVSLFSQSFSSSESLKAAFKFIKILGHLKKQSIPLYFTDAIKSIFSYELGYAEQIVNSVLRRFTKKLVDNFLKNH